MKVICTGNTKRLVKGATYEVLSLKNLDTSNSKYFRPHIVIKLNETNNCTLNIRNFKLENGDPLPEINWTSDEWKNKQTEYGQSRISTTNPIKIGDYVSYVRNSHKGLIFGKIYKVTNIREFQHKSYGGSIWTELEIQIEGSTRFYKTYSFRKCTPQESREISLNTLFDEETGVISIDKSIRKIDKYEDQAKETLLIKILMSAALDTNRNNMSIIEWACNKTGNQFDVKPDDFNSIITNSLSSILDKLN
jgi:hypothetical protein